MVFPCISGEALGIARRRASAEFFPDWMSGYLQSQSPCHLQHLLERTGRMGDFGFAPKLTGPVILAKSIVIDAARIQFAWLGRRLRPLEPNHLLRLSNERLWHCPSGEEFGGLWWVVHTRSSYEGAGGRQAPFVRFLTHEADRPLGNVFATECLETMRLLEFSHE